MICQCFGIVSQNFSTPPKKNVVHLQNCIPLLRENATSLGVTQYFLRDNANVLCENAKCIGGTQYFSRIMHMFSERMQSSLSILHFLLCLLRR